MTQAPDLYTRLIIWSAIVGWPVVLVIAWALNRRWGDKYDRLGKSSSEEMIGELETAYAPRRSIVIPTTTEYLPFVFEWIREVIDGGFDELHTQTLLGRIDFHRPGDQRQAVFPVEVSGRTVDLLFQWSRDSEDRVRLRVTAAPRIIRVLREKKKTIPKVAMVR
jgi:hypothetical protein